MTVKQLIKELEKMPPDAHVFHIWDGEPRTEINFVWLCKVGQVMTADYSEDCTIEEALPVDEHKHNRHTFMTPSCHMDRKHFEDYI